MANETQQKLTLEKSALGLTLSTTAFGGGLSILVDTPITDGLLLGSLAGIGISAMVYAGTMANISGGAIKKRRNQQQLNSVVTMFKPKLSVKNNLLNLFSVNQLSTRNNVNHYQTPLELPETLWFGNGYRHKIPESQLMKRLHYAYRNPKYGKGMSSNYSAQGWDKSWHPVFVGMLSELQNNLNQHGYIIPLLIKYENQNWLKMGIKPSQVYTMLLAIEHPNEFQRRVGTDASYDMAILKSRLPMSIKSRNLKISENL